MDNQLFPIFLQLNHLRTLLVGGGGVALEKLTALLRNSPQASVTVVAKRLIPEVRAFVRDYPSVQVFERAFDDTDLDNADLVVVASNNPFLNAHIRQESRKRHLLINVADKPDLCDFYLGSIVKKGNLKLGISTNGKSPTMAKRIKELLDESIPDEIDETLQYMSELRDLLKGDFTDKVRELNAHTASLLMSKRTHGNTGR
ncbi:bifunctional precorrin-2 dehydrogenase/sirohydrochlorin ferrochelatase [Parapedobacter sp. ISTM3]|uniref:precorrin-2 dehydrogenase n=1 Tax=Parapedobacter luteus TaxID=623280 RepID=A0A1T5AZC5_9SPHI|nr:MULTISPECIES: bifunctional precorrin-2 dehydrogenase/sirohydrochlorin ferrochelatase [Parapedobacter]MBK1440386.1 bifunctional precorrin-2 dehydrogenase/sirohydrochlorin ferrochelatase [Parapedobacter sp. ISTM3]SKB40179.1 precorrin-2 dehydrogenase / sirohydrochlorin ferrochelatase [Parapedobacter luteus]